MFRTIICVLLITVVDCNYELYECPAGWEDFDQFCYKFVRFELLTVNGAKDACAKDGAFLLSVNNDMEHSFVIESLNIHDPGQTKKDWWTSGRRVSDVDSLQFYWEGDGQQIESYFYWHNDSIPTDFTKDFIMYNYNDLKFYWLQMFPASYNWGWILGAGPETMPYVCKISKEDIFKIQEHERGPDYGNPDPDPEDVHRGPRFRVQPQDTVHEPVVTEAVAADIVTLECIADAVPEPSYEWYKQRGTLNEKVDPSTDSRYTFINGRLVIDSPSSERADDGRYQCAATNIYGTILSNQVELAFGFLQDFPKSPRSKVVATEYQWASIECNPPKHYPEELHYTWYKNTPSNFVRTELKPYIFISKDSRLYFSEVTSDDNGQYYCVAQKPGVTWSSGVESMPTQLSVVAGSPGEYDPEVGSGFPNVWPKNPKVGDTIWLECWASGTSQPQLNYFWDKVEVNNNGRVTNVLPLPNQARLTDHNRVVQIPNVQLYDGGVYRCRVDRTNGGATSKTVQVMLQAEPSFVVRLKDQFVDVGASLTWRCEASGIPKVTYSWLKNGLPLEDQILPGDEGRVVITNNALSISNLNEELDNGMYQCAATNTHGTRYSSGELRVLSFPPSFVKYPLQVNQFATKGGNTTIMCRPEAAPSPVITWFKNNGQLNPGTDENSRVRQMPNGNLFISPVELNDEGVYKCHAANELGEASSTGNLTVLATVTISLPPEMNTITVNKTHFVHCVASYEPQLDVTYYWYHSGRLIDFEIIYRLGENRYEIWRNPHYKRGSGLYIGGLYIMNTQYEHEGDYNCVVESSAGDRIERSAYIMVQGPPSEPAGVYIDSNTVTETSVMIQWKAAGDNNQNILSYVIEANNTWEGFYRIIRTNVQVEPDPGDLTETLRYNVTGLRPYSRYAIRVRAENKLGTSEPSQPSDEFWTLCIKPDLYPQEVGGGGGKVGELVITWKPLEPWQENCKGIGYKIYWKPLGDEEWGERIETIYGPRARHVKTVGEVNFYKEYEVAVQAFNDIGEGPMSPIAVIRSAMKPPKAQVSNVRAQPFNSTACLVTWIPVEDTREAVFGKLGGYRLAYWETHLGIDFERSWRVTIDGQASEGLVIGLYPNTPYYFAVYVWNEAGNGPKSEHFQQRTLRHAPLSQPVEIEVKKRSETAIHVFWRGFSTTQREEPLEGYKVRMWREGEDIKNATDYNAGKESDLYIDDLNPDILYKLRVFGWSRGGEGAMSFPTMKFMLGGSNTLHLSASILTMTLLLSIWGNL